MNQAHPLPDNKDSFINISSCQGLTKTPQGDKVEPIPHFKVESNGGPDEVRTHDLWLAKPSLSQLSYQPIMIVLVSLVNDLQYFC